jgi:hypothetical protein
VEVAFCRGVLKANSSGLGAGGRHSNTSRPPRAVLALIPHDYVADTGVNPSSSSQHDNQDGGDVDDHNNDSNDDDEQNSNDKTIKLAVAAKYATIQPLTINGLTPTAAVNDNLNGADSLQQQQSLNHQEQGHKPFWISSNELKILALKKLLEDQYGIKSVLKVVEDKHQLVVPGDVNDPTKLVIVRQSNESSSNSFSSGGGGGGGTSSKRLLLEGSLCPVYFEVRKAIYKTMTLV